MDRKMPIDGPHGCRIEIAMKNRITIHWNTELLSPENWWPKKIE
jgi:hypothetical protein